MTTTARTLDDRRWLLDLLGPELLAAIHRPLTDEETAKVGAFLDSIEAEIPLNAAVMNASDEDLPAVVERLLGERVTR
jgi:hypothetical protein